MAKIPPDKLLVGAHVSITGGIHKALIRGQEIGATTIQIFTANQKQWSGKTISQDEVELWKEWQKKTDIQKIMSHDSYLINLGASNPIILTKSRKAFKEEIKRCLQLNLSFLNFHPGAATGDSEEHCLNKIATSLLECESLLQNTKLRLLIETTAGQGTSVGHRFEHLAYLIGKVKHKIPVGVCIDTCHVFAAGYDLRTKSSWETVLKEFQKIVGMKYLYAFHVNDSVHPLGSRKDRHASLGKGKIGVSCFKVMMTHPKLREIPKYLETPLGDKRWKDEIAALRRFAGGKG
jgi:deoxyribonuclease-4